MSLLPFRLYLFKEKALKIKRLDIYNYFLQYQEVQVKEQKESKITLEYKSPSIGCSFEVVLSESLMVPNISKLNSSYLSLSSYIEIPFTTPDYSTDKIFEIIKKLTSRYSIQLYNELFENIIPFRANVLRQAFNSYRFSFKKNCKDQYNSYYIMDKNKLNECLKYQDQQYEIQAFFKDSGKNIKAPNYMFLENNYRPYVAIEWNESEEILFPPKLDIIYFVTKEEIIIYYAKDVLEALKKVLEPFNDIIGSKIIYEKHLKKVKKLIKKAKLLPVEIELNPIRLFEVIDF